MVKTLKQSLQFSRVGHDILLRWLHHHDNVSTPDLSSVRLNHHNSYQENHVMVTEGFGQQWTAWPSLWTFISILGYVVIIWYHSWISAVWWHIPKLWLKKSYIMIHYVVITESVVHGSTFCFHNWISGTWFYILLS